MATKRTPIKRATHRRITPEAVAAFRLCEEIREAGGDEHWEDEGGRRREYLTAHSDLHRALGLKLWETSPLDAVTAVPPDYYSDKFRAPLWAQAWALRGELEKAVV